MTRRIRYIFGALTHIIYKELSGSSGYCSLDYNKRFKQTSTKNSGPGPLLMQVIQEKVYREKYEIPLGGVRFEPTPATAAAASPSESGPQRLLKNKYYA